MLDVLADHNQLGTLVTFNPCVVVETARLDECLQLMDANGFHHLPVVDVNHQVVGIVSDVDISEALRSDVGEDNGADAISRVMARDVVTVELDASPEHVLRTLLTRRVHGAPVVKDHCLVGMITSSDFLRELSGADWALSSVSVLHHAAPPLGRIDVGATLLDAGKLLRGRRNEYLVVLENNRTAGVISWRQCRRAASNALNCPDQLATVGALLRGPATVLSCERTLAESVSTLLSSPARAAAIVDSNLQALGILREDDVLRAMLGCMDA